MVAALAMLMTGVVFATLGVLSGIWAESFDQHAFIANIVITPLALIGGVFYSAHSLAQPWATLTRLDPLYYLVDATRAGLTGVHEATPGISLASTAAVAAVGFVIATVVIARGWRLKP
jgi:ABC-2 type transport system permease protein